MVLWIFYLFLLLHFVESNVRKTTQSNNPSDDFTSSLPDLWISFKNKTQYAVNQSLCLEGWQPFGGSCYYLSNVTLNSNKTNNETCKYHYQKNIQLMEIRHPFEIYFAAYILNKIHVWELLVQVDPHLSKDKSFVKCGTSPSTKKKFRRKFRQGKESVKPQDNEGTYNDIQGDESTETQMNSYSTNEKIAIINIEEFDDIHRACDQLSWCANDDGTDVFRLIIAKDWTSKGIICSIDYVASDKEYEHMCQYVFDFCFGNDRCGNHGSCVNNSSGFNCSCKFYVEGQFCDKPSKKLIHLIVGIIIIIVFSILNYCKCQRYRDLITNKLFSYCKQQATTSNPMSNNNTQSESPSETPKLSHMWVKIIVFTIIFCCLLFIPLIYHDLSKNNLLRDDNVQLSTQCEHQHIFFRETYILIIISITLCVVFYFIKQNSDRQNVQLGLESSIDPFTLTNRSEIVALCCLVVLELLMTLENFFTDLSQLWDDGILVQLAKRTLIPVVYGIRYLPLFVSLQQRGRTVRWLAFVYILINIIYVILRRSLCISEFWGFSKQYSPSQEAKQHREIIDWISWYSTAKYFPQTTLLSYIGSELFNRFFFGSKYPYVEISNNSWSWIKFPKCIYKWDDDIQYTTIAMCSFGISFILIYYLTCVFTFQFIIGASSIYFLKSYVKSIFNIEINIPSFNSDIYFTAGLVFLIFTYRILKAMMKYKKHTKDLRDNRNSEIPRLTEEEMKLIVKKSNRYLSSIFLKILGSYFIWFHIILFITIIIFRTVSFLISHPYLLPNIVYKSVSIGIPTSIFYILQTFITKWFCTFIPQNPTLNINQKFSGTCYGILVYFTFLISCNTAIISTLGRLSKNMFYNLLKPQFDSSGFEQKDQNKNDAFMTYVSFLYMEKSYRSAIQSNSTENLSDETQRLPTNPET